jgi:hypothetical protein
VPIKTIEVPFSDPPVPFEVASIILSFVAYPDDIPGRKRFFRELCRREHIMEEQKRWRQGSPPKLIRPIILTSQDDANWLKGLHTLRLHLVAANEMLSPFISAHETGRRPLAREGGLPATVENIASILLEREGRQDGSVSTFITRYWMPIRPIAHLAFSLAELVYAARWKALKPGWKHIEQIISPYPDDVLASRILQRAEAVRMFLPELEQVRFSEDRTVSFIARKVALNNLSLRTGTEAQL